MPQRPRERAHGVRIWPEAFHRRLRGASASQQENVATREAKLESFFAEDDLDQGEGFGPGVDKTDNN